MNHEDTEGTKRMVTPEELRRYRNDVVFHDLVQRFRNYVDSGLGRYEDIIAAAEFARKIHWADPPADEDE